MTYFQDVMVDIETGGTQPDRTPIIQIAAVPFNLQDLKISNECFCRSLMVPPHRFWDEGTRVWWSEQKADVLAGILAAAEPPAQVMESFYRWSANLGGNLRFWAKPTSFDYAFVQSYCRDYELPMPFHYRLARDVNTFIEARHFPNSVPKIELSDHGDAHNALNDCFYQIEMVFRHFAATKQ